MISEKIKGWLNKTPEIEEETEAFVVEEETEAPVLKKEFEMKPEVKAPVREEDMEKLTADGEKVPSFL